MSKVLVCVRGNLNIVDTLNPDGTIVTLSVDTMELLAAAHGYIKMSQDDLAFLLEMAKAGAIDTSGYDDKNIKRVESLSELLPTIEPYRGDGDYEENPDPEPCVTDLLPVRPGETAKMFKVRLEAAKEEWKAQRQLIKKQEEENFDFAVRESTHAKH